MNNLQVLNFQNNDVRMIMIDGEPWWVAKDVCDVLEHTNPTMATDRLDEDERAKFNLGRQGETNVVNESGLYSLILGSRKPQAKEFKRWITHEVIPSIRKYGSYEISAQINNFSIPKTFPEALRLAADLQEKNEALESKIEQDKPLVDFANGVSNTDKLISVSEMAKLLNADGMPMGQKRLFTYMRDAGLLQHNNEPYQQYVNRGLFKVREVSRMTAYGRKYFVQTMITGKGQKYLFDRIKREFTETNSPIQLMKGTDNHAANTNTQPAGH